MTATYKRKRLQAARGVLMTTTSTLKLREVESYCHKDNRGTTHKYECGCMIVFRGIHMRRKFCSFHGGEWVGTEDARLSS